MAIERLFCHRVAIRLFRLKVKGTEKQPEAYRMHIHAVIPQSRNLGNPSILQENKTTFENGLHNCMSDTGVKIYSIKLNGDRGLFAE